MVGIRTIPAGDGIGHLELVDARRRNPMDHHVLDSIEEAVLGRQFAAVVLSAVPGPAFCAGGDLTLRNQELSRLSDRIYDFCRQLRVSPTIFIVAADGLAIGSGAQLFLVADIRFVGASAVLRPSDPQRGLAAGTWSLPDLVGVSTALSLLLTGDSLDAGAICDLRLARAVSLDPVSDALELASCVAGQEELFRARVKRAVAAATQPAASAMSVEAETFARPGPRREEADG